MKLKFGKLFSTPTKHIQMITVHVTLYITISHKFNYKKDRNIFFNSLPLNYKMLYLIVYRVTEITCYSVNRNKCGSSKTEGEKLGNIIVGLIKVLQMCNSYVCPIIRIRSLEYISDHMFVLL